MSEEEERARGTGWLRSGPDGEDAEDAQSTRDRDQWTLPPPVSSELRDRERRERVEAFRRGYLAENVAPRLPRISTPPARATAHEPSNSSLAFLESALKYLSELRECTRYEDALSTAIDHGLATKEFFADKHDDFVMDLDGVAPLPYSSWLRPGGVFNGHQHATGCGPNVTQQDLSAVRSRVEQINPNYHNTYTPSSGFDHPPSGSYSRFDHPPGSTRVSPYEYSSSRTWQPHNPTPPTFSLSASSLTDKGQHDHWPVRVVVHAVNTEKMSLQGTMEAYDVPQHSGPGLLSSMHATGEPPKAGKKSAPITTYLEGHIIDFRTHTFLTPGGPDEKKSSTRGAAAPNTRSRDIVFPSASAAADAENWLKLPPFNTSAPESSSHRSEDSPADTLARLLLSTHALAQLNEEYIFMRWKERCFVHNKHSTCDSTPAERQGDQDRGHGLTISGFYYVSLRRSDGRVEGLYFDPSSTPYQCLRLEGSRGGVGSWEFR